MLEKPVHACVIDIGSNSIRYMHAAVTHSNVTAVERKRLITTRLAQGIVHGLLSEEATRRSLTAIAAFTDIARASAVPFVFAYATSAVRDAKNGKLFCDRVQRETGVTVDILSGEQEARLAYLGSTGPGGGGLIDIGGGSAQVMTAQESFSFPIGCVRAKDAFPNIPLTNMRQAIRDWLDEKCAVIHTIRQPRWTGVGGTITTLAALQAGLSDYDPAIVSAQVLTMKSLCILIERLDNMADARRQHPLLKDRHDIILYGSCILAYLMRRMEIHSLYVSDKDGMEGYLLDKAYVLLGN